MVSGCWPLNISPNQSQNVNDHFPRQPVSFNDLSIIELIEGVLPISVDTLDALNPVVVYYKIYKRHFFLMIVESITYKLRTQNNSYACPRPHLGLRQVLHLGVRLRLFKKRDPTSRIDLRLRPHLGFFKKRPPEDLRRSWKL